MKICTMEGCNNKYRAKGYCMKHYKRMWRNGSSGLKEPKQHDIYTPENNYFLNVLSKTKKRLNLTGEELATLIDTRIDTYRKWSQGKTTPNEEIQDKVLKILKDNV